MNNDSHNQKSTAPHLLLGRIGEELAATWLMNHGFRIFHRNWRSKYGHELDIVAYKDNRLHFVEVKTRSSNYMYDPLYAIDKIKLQHLARAAYVYKKYFRLNFPPTFDAVVVIYRSENDYDLKFVPDILL